MDWETPSFLEIDMSAEIGAYQSDFSEFDTRRIEAERDADSE